MENVCQPVLNHIPDPVKDWTIAVVIGFFTVSHWRGLWTLFDIWICGQPEHASLTGGDTFCFAADAAADNFNGDKRLDSAIVTYIIGIGCSVLGTAMMWAGLWTYLCTPNYDSIVTRPLAFVRFIIVYILGMAAVCTWRAIWYITDHLIYPDNTLLSWWVTMSLGTAGAFLLCSGGSLLAPPAIFLLDGPDINPPPIAVTIVPTYYSLALKASDPLPDLSLWLRMMDLFVSFIVLPIFVVWYWRGAWLLLDHYLWGFSASHKELNLSIFWSAVIAVFCTVFTSEPIMYFFSFGNRVKSEIISRVRTYIMAWGTVAFWRVVWYIWDQFLGGPTVWSCWISHMVSIACLTMMGCLSGITAPPSTLGCDRVPHPESMDAPLFSMLPLPWELLYFGAIGRQKTASCLLSFYKDESLSNTHHKVSLAGAANTDEIELTKVQTPVVIQEVEVEEVTEKTQADGRMDTSEVHGASQLDSSGRAAQIVHSLHVRISSIGDSSYHQRQRPALSLSSSSGNVVSRRLEFLDQSTRRRSNYSRNR